MYHKNHVPGWSEVSAPAKDFPVADDELKRIAEHGFFSEPGSLAAARAACAELVFARAMIKAQTTKIEQMKDASRLTV